MKSAQNNLKLRYALLKYYYSIFVAKRGLGTIFKPLFFEFPADNNLYVDDLDSQFLIGPNLMAAPIVEPNTTSRKVYFPAESWYNIHSGIQYQPGTTLLKDVELTDKVPLFIR